MGQKVSPHGLRVGVIQDWDSKWYADKNNFLSLYFHKCSSIHRLLKVHPFQLTTMQLKSSQG